MCMQSSSVVPYQKWHWAGDEIVHESSIPASRPLPGIGLRKRYPIDIREFLSIEGNAVVRRELGNLYKQLRDPERLRFLARDRGNFDFRAERVLRFFRRRVRFIEAGRRRFDDWQFPEETLARGGGDWHMFPWGDAPADGGYEVHPKSWTRKRPSKEGNPVATGPRTRQALGSQETNGHAWSGTHHR